MQVLPWAHEVAVTPLSKSNTDALTPVGVKFVGRLLNVPVLPSSATRAVGVDFVTCRVMPRLVQKGVRHITPERQAQVLLTLLGQSPRAINDTLGFGYTTPETALPGYRRTLIGSAHRVFTSRQLMKMYDAAVAHIASNATRRVDKARADKVPLLPN